MVVIDDEFVQKIERVTGTIIERIVSYQSRRFSRQDNPLTTFNGATCLIRPAAAGVSRIHGLGIMEPWEDGMLYSLEEILRASGALCEVAMNPYASTSLSHDLLTNHWTLAYWIQVLAIDLENRPVGPEYPSSATIHEVAGKEVAPWSIILARGFEDHPIKAQADPATHRRAAKMVGMHCYLAKQGDTLVGAASLNMADDFGVMYAGSTLIPHRRKGIHTALLEHRIRYAAKLGARYAVLMTFPGSGSERNAKRLGFESVYVQPIYTKSFAEQN